MVNFYSCFLFGTHFHWIITKLLHAFTFVLSYFLHIQFSHNIFLIARNHINLYKFMSFGTKKWWGKVKKEIELIMNSIIITPS